MGYRAKLTSKGQTTIPIEVRKYLRLQPGDEMDFSIENGEVKIKAKTRSIMEFAGILGQAPSGINLTTNEMDGAVADAAAEDDRRIVRDWNRHQRASEIPDGGRSDTARKRD